MNKKTISIQTLKKEYFLYILKTSRNTLYVGQTNNLEVRLKQHRSKTTKAAKYTKYFDTLELIYTENYPSRRQAMQREAQIKRWSRKKKDALIRGDKVGLKKL